MAIVDIGTEGPLCRLDVGRERIRGQLDSVRQSLGKIRYERRRGREIPLTYAVCRDDLRLGIERNEGVLIAKSAVIVEGRHVALLLADISPDLINLDPATGKLTHLLIHELRSTVADLDE